MSPSDLPTEETKRRDRTARLLGLSLAGLVILLYLPAATFDFVNWDDPWYVINNSLIKSWHPANLYRLFTEVAIKNYAPLTLFSYLIEHTLWGLQPEGYHITNILLHALNASLVFVLVRNLTNSSFVGWMTAAFFAVHPVQIETVAWIASRKGLLSGTFILVALIHRLKPKPTERNEGFFLVFLVLALLTKAIAIVVPLTVLTYDIFVRKLKPSEAIARQFIPAFFCICLLSITMSAQTTLFGGLRGHMELSKGHILAVDTVIVWRYIGMLIQPTDLCVLYDPPTTGIANGVILASIGWLAVTALVYRLRRRNPLLVLAAVSFIGFLLPVLNLFPITTLMNDRYLYLPSIPCFALVAAGLLKLSVTMKASENFSSAVLLKKAPAFAAAAVILVALSWNTRNHLPVWRNDAALWEHANQHVGHLAVVQIQRAHARQRDGNPEQAVTLLESALQNCNPDPADKKRILQKIDDWK